MTGLSQDESVIHDDMGLSAKDVQRLREMTGVGMMDCKKALSESDGDFDKAVEFLREKGLAAAAKKAGRIAAEGVVYAYVCGKTGDAVIVEVNSETDFVAKNDSFQEFVVGVAKTVKNTKITDVDKLLKEKYLDSSLTVGDTLQEKILTIGENIKIRRAEIIGKEPGIVNVSYVHMGGKIAVLVSMQVSEGLEDNAQVLELGHDVALQVASMRPQWLDRKSVPADTLEKEKAILLAQTLEEGRPAAVAEKIVMGRINKFFEDNCLVDQTYVKENKLTVGKHVEEVVKLVGGSVKLMSFVRYEKGEGLAKREDNFAEEVANMTK